MRKLCVDYSNIIAYTFLGLIFGFSFFLLFINLYHYENISGLYKKDSIVDKRIDDAKKKLVAINKNITSVDVNEYSGSIDKISILNLYSKLDLCLNNFDNENINTILNKSEVGIIDVYNLLKYYQNDILNDCMVLQLYDLDESIDTSSLENIAGFVKINIDSLLNDTSYIKKNLENNSSYFMGSSVMKNTVFDFTRDNYIKVVDSYFESVNLIYQLSVFYKSLVVGEI